MSYDCRCARPMHYPGDVESVCLSCDKFIPEYMKQRRRDELERNPKA